jgi:hypothetical protein
MWPFKKKLVEKKTPVKESVDVGKIIFRFACQNGRSYVSTVIGVAHRCGDGRYLFKAEVDNTLRVWQANGYVETDDGKRVLYHAIEGEVGFSEVLPHIIEI